MKSIITNTKKYTLFDSFIDLVSDASRSNVYIGIGRVPDWTANDSIITTPTQSTDYTNDAFRNLVALKKLNAYNFAMVVPRIDWTTGISYDAYDNTVDLFDTVTATAANGTVNVSSTSVVVTGQNTDFLINYSLNDTIRLYGDGTEGSEQEREIVRIANATSMNVNMAFGVNYVNNVSYKIVDAFPYYAKKFYVRNTKDQVFKCLFNNNGASSTDMPQISIGGQLPESSYIATSDGYKWKYLYTIDASNKRKFLTDEWMPVLKNQTVVDYATSGIIDIVKIVSPGSGYNSNLPAANVRNLTITGDGVGASLSAKVNSAGSIYEINVLDGGSGYTSATITANGSGSGANLVAVIGPANGHGYDPIYELGASTLFLSVDLVGDENSTIPTSSSGSSDSFDYHQIVVIRDPLLTTGDPAFSVNYDTTSKIYTNGGGTFQPDEIVYQGPVASPTFKATAVAWDSLNKILSVNNPIGTFKTQNFLIGATSGATTTATSLSDPAIAKFTGKILYINNTTGIVRSAQQTETIKLNLSIR